MEILRFLEGIRTPFFDKVFQYITYFGEQVMLIAVICLLFWCVDKNFGYKIGFSFFFAGLLLQGLKITFRIRRPWDLDPDKEFKAVESALKGATGYSFPSGHTQAATSVFFSLALFFKKTWLKILCVVMFLLVGFSRMYLGVHTFKDVIVGMSLGLVSVLIFNWLFEKIRDDRSNDTLILVIMCLMSVGLIVYAILMYNAGHITYVASLPGEKEDPLKYAYDCCKAGGAGLGFALGWFTERKFINYSVKVPKDYMQVIKMAVGLAAAFVIMEGPKWIFGESIAIDIIRYLLVAFWCVAVFPYLVKLALKKYEERKRKAE